MPSFDVSDPSALIEGLDPETPYRVRVSATNPAGSSDPSGWVDFTTLPEQAGGDPVPLETRADYYGIADPYGSVQGMSRAQMDDYMDAIAATGATWWRTDIRVYEVEATSGNRSWSELDDVVAAAKGAGLRVLLCPSTIPAWAREGSPSTWQRGAITSGERAAYIAFCVAAVQRYPQVDAWELWNEPNYGTYWSPEPTTAAAYLTLLKEAYPAVKAAAPAGVPILTGGTAVVGAPAGAWYEHIFANGGGDYCDGVCMHPYPDIGWSRAGQPFSGYQMEEVAAARTAMDAAGHSDMRIWATENGYPTFSGYSVSEADQAAWMPVVWEGWYDQETVRGATGPSFIYQYQDQDSSDTTTAEAHFGIVRSTGVLKPAHAAMLDWSTEEE